MTSQQADERDAVSRLITQLGVGGLVAHIPEITEQPSEYFLLSGERRKAAQCTCDCRILQRAAQAFRK